MPTRLIRSDILTSDTVAQLPWVQRVFYFGLLLTADDYGLYDARPHILRTKIFPCDLNKVSDRDIQDYHAKCVELGLVKAYTVDGHSYGQVLKFGQQYKSHPKHPLPDWADPEEYQPKPKKSTSKRNETPRGVAKRNESIRTAANRYLDEDEDEDEGECEDGGERNVATLPCSSPPTADEVRRVMDALMLAPLVGKVMDECVARYMDDMEANGWVNRNGVPLRDWRGTARNWARRYAEREIKSPSSSTASRRDCNDPARYRKNRRGC